MGRIRLIAGACLTVVLASGQAKAEDPEVQALRAQLRSTVLQLRALQDQQAAPAPAAAAPAPGADAGTKAKLASSQREVAAATRRAAELQAALAKAQADFATGTAASAANAAAELEKAKAAYALATLAARDSGVERDRLKLQLAQMTKVANACQMENTRLVALAESILDDYRKAGVLKALEKREPFLGFRRVQLENIAQDREDAVRANRCDPLPSAGPSKPSTPVF